MAIVAGVFYLGGCTHYAEWTLVGADSATSVYLIDKPGESLPTFRGEVTINNDFQTVMYTMTNFAEFNQWVYQCESVEVVEFINFSEAYLYQVNSLPVIRDRDIIVHGTVSYDTVNHTGTPGDTEAMQRAVIQLSSVPTYCDDNLSEACVRINESTYVRVKESKGIFKVIQLSDDQVKVQWEQSVDPEGWIPHWLTRMMIADVPATTLNNLKQRLENVN